MTGACHCAQLLAEMGSAAPTWLAVPQSLPILPLAPALLPRGAALLSGLVLSDQQVLVPTVGAMA
jgi:hypothetical protein